MAFLTAVLLIQIDANYQLFQQRWYRWSLCETQHWNTCGIFPVLASEEGQVEEDRKLFFFLWCLTKEHLSLKSVLQKYIPVCETDPYQDITNIFDYSINTQKQM